MATIVVGSGKLKVITVQRTENDIYGSGNENENEKAFSLGLS